MESVVGEIVSITVKAQADTSTYDYLPRSVFVPLEWRLFRTLGLLSILE